MELKSDKLVSFEFLARQDEFIDEGGILGLPWNESRGRLGRNGSTVNRFVWVGRQSDNAILNVAHKRFD